MTSKADATEAFVWTWLPGATEPVVAGRLDQDGARTLYLWRQLPQPQERHFALRARTAPSGRRHRAHQRLADGEQLRDASPDAWGRRVIINKLTGTKPDADGVSEIGELTYLLQSGSDRIGALDFQASATEYVPSHAAQASLDELIEAASLIEKGVSLTRRSNWPAAAEEVSWSGAPVASC
ncbi:hypothetical protein C8J38_1244 [Rhizobium sp. PP-WC-2G-219]|nr:hypothetical protein DFI02_104325 [Rhizobium sp. PP-F2F-G20b]TCL88050.1 hypothetical protein C8J38_1244 [Rhizobium sp. PP-WC-2G-219]